MKTYLKLLLCLPLFLVGCSAEKATEEKKYMDKTIYAEKNVLLVDGKPAKDILFEGNIYPDQNGSYYFMDCRSTFQGLLTENTFFVVSGTNTLKLKDALPFLKKSEKANMVATFAWGYDYDGNWINPFPEKQKNSMPEEVHVLMVGFSTMNAISSFRESEEKGYFH